MAESLDDLLRSAFTDEALRRMTRRGGVASSAAKGDLALNTELRKQAKAILSNIFDKAMVYVEYRKSKKIDENILRETLEHLSVKSSHYSAPPFTQCETLRSREARKKASAKSGAKKRKSVRGNLAKREITHENRQDDCVYMERAPFVRLCRHMVTQRRANTRMTSEAFSWLQFIIESLLISLLRDAGTLATEITKGHTLNAKSKRIAVNARDIQTVAAILSDCWPVLSTLGHPKEDAPAAPAKASAGRGSGRGRGGRGGRGRGSEGRGRGGSDGGRGRGGSGGGRGGRAAGSSRGGREGKEGGTKKARGSTRKRK